MSSTIHPTAIVDPKAQVGEGVKIGPFCLVGPDVVLGAGVELVSHVVVAGRTTIGARGRIFPFASIGHPPQDLKYRGEPSTLTVGDDCIIREGVTMNPGTEGGGMATVIGNSCAFLANSHVAHDCRLGDDIILSNNVMLAGHVHVGDRAILSGGCAVHQFTRIDRQAFIGGLSAVNYDVIPYGMLNGNPGILGGLNVVGMTRAGIEKSVIHTVRRAFKQIFEAEGAVRANAAAIRDEYVECKEVIEILDFIAAEGDRSFSSPRRGSKG